VAARPALHVEGLKELRRAVVRARDKEIGRELRAVNRSIAQRIVDRALPRVPVRSGRLRSSVKAIATQSSASGKAGSASRVPYAPAIHWGWPRRNITANRFLTDAAADVEQGVVEEYGEALSSLWRDLSARR
jgi:hypothetical protein